jgi:hypothetical protein
VPDRRKPLNADPLDGSMKSFLPLILAVLLSSDESIADVFETADDFSVMLPSGWVEAPAEALRNMEAAVEKASQGGIKQQFDYGYQLSSASVWFEYPYIIVQVNRKRRVPEGQLAQYERSHSEIREGMEKAEDSFGDLLSGMEQGETLYDETDHVLWSTMTMSVQGAGAVRGLIAVKLTEFGFIQLMGYATQDTFAQYAPVFRGAVSSLAIADQYKYQPRLTDHAPTIWGINLGQVAIAGLFGGLAGGVVALIGYVKRKRKRRDG